MYVRPLFFLLALIIHGGAGNLTAADKPTAFYITWFQDPCRTAVIRWITCDNDHGDWLELQKSEPKKANEASQNWYRFKASHKKFPDNRPYVLHSLELYNLSPDTSYAVHLEEYDHIFYFRTLPESLDHPVRFVAGGDTFRDGADVYNNMNRIAASYSPYFAALGGDIAYATTPLPCIKEDTQRWLCMLQGWMNHMVTPEGFSVPLVAAIGNHEVVGWLPNKPEKAAFYYLFFRNPSMTSYFCLNIGDYMSLLLLDSGHTEKVNKTQKDFIEEKLAAAQSMEHRFAIYHAPAYPSARRYNACSSKKMRKHWCPLFDKYQLHIAFENHDHAYKRTPAIKNECPNPKGTVYIGDGCWGIAEPRTPRVCENYWYLKKSASIGHCLIVDLDQKQRTVRAVDWNGKVFDSVTQKVDSVMHPPL